MSFTVYTDGCSNLPGELLERHDIRVLPCHYEMDGQPRVYDGNMEAFDFHAYYEKLRGGSTIKTSLLNTHLFIDTFTPVLEQGQDVVYVGMSSGISGTIHAATIAA